MEEDRSTLQVGQVCILNMLVMLSFVLLFMILNLIMSFMFLNHPKILLPFTKLLRIIMSFLNFTLISSLSRIGSRGKLFFKAGLREVSIPSLAALLLHLVERSFEALVNLINQDGMLILVTLLRQLLDLWLAKIIFLVLVMHP
jgi:hypothetical protein